MDQACVKGRGQGGHMPTQILADQKAPPAAPARRITACPPRFLDFDTCLWMEHSIFILPHREDLITVHQLNDQLPVGSKKFDLSLERSNITKVFRPYLKRSW